MLCRFAGGALIVFDLARSREGSAVHENRSCAPSSRAQPSLTSAIFASGQEVGLKSEAVVFCFNEPRCAFAKAIALVSQSTFCILLGTDSYGCEQPETMA